MFVNMGIFIRFSVAYYVNHLLVFLIMLIMYFSFLCLGIVKYIFLI